MITALKEEIKDAHIMAVGTNSVATSAMLKAGADEGATGENSIIVACRKADVIVGPLGITIADAMLGEITPKMAAAIGGSESKRVLIPFKNCDSIIVGLEEYTVGQLVKLAIEEVKKLKD